MHIYICTSISSNMFVQPLKFTKKVMDLEHCNYLKKYLHNIKWKDCAHKICTPKQLTLACLFCIENKTMSKLLIRASGAIFIRYKIGWCTCKRWKLQ